MTNLRMWWYRHGQRSNFGDELGIEILRALGNQVERVPLNQADMIGIGSILELAAHEGRQGLVVWGSGFMTAGKPVPKLDVRAVRGTLTRSALGVDVPVGDPGLLCSLLWKRPPVKHRIGVIPHLSDNNRYPWADVVIDVTAPVVEVLHQIGSCAAIASSSLHGIIAAHAYGIPAMRLHHPLIIGGEHKWADYITGYDADLETVQRRLLDALPEGVSRG